MVTNAVNAQVVKDTLVQNVDTLEAADNEETLTEPIDYYAEDSIVYLASSNKLLFYGKAKVNYGAYKIESEYIEIDSKTNIISAYGKKDSTGKLVGTPKFNDGGEQIEAEKIMFNAKTKRGKIYNALTKQGDLLVVGQQIKKDSTNIIYMKDMACIPCQEADARTRFKATRAKIIPDDKIITGPMFLEIGGVPTPLGLPFGYFPNSKRQKNGILIPTPGYSENQGFSLRNLGFYWGINDKTDFTAFTDVYTNGSFAIRTINNYNVLYKASGSFQFDFNNLIVGDKDIPKEFSKNRGYAIRWNHTQDNRNNPTIRFGANVNFANNQNINRFNSFNSNQFLQNSFQSNINLTKTFKWSSLSLNATHNQTTSGTLTPVSISFPQLTFNVNRFFPFKRENAVKQNVFDKIGMSYLFEAQNRLTGFDSTIFRTSDIADRFTYGIRHSLPISTNFNLLKYLTLTPAINLTSVMYTKSQRQQFVADPTSTLGGKIVKDTVNGFVAGYDANFSTSLNTKVFFDYMYKSGKVKQIRHLLIPTLAYTYRPDFGEEQYGFWKTVQRDVAGNTSKYNIFDNTIFGGPDIGKQNALSLNLNNNIEAKLKVKSDTGITYKKVSLIENISASGSYNFAADSLKMSLLGLSARTTLFKYFNVLAAATFDPYGYDPTTKIRVSKYAKDVNGRLVNFSNATFAVNTSFGSDRLAALKKIKQAPDMNNKAEGATSKNKAEESQEKLPWDISLNYNLGLTSDVRKIIQPTHQLSSRLNVQPTKYWKVGVTTGFDFVTQKISYTSVNIYRDLKCWEARIDWVPFGLRKSYFLTLNLKSSMFSEMKIPKRSPPEFNNLNGL